MPVLRWSAAIVLSGKSITFGWFEVKFSIVEMIEWLFSMIVELMVEHLFRLIN